MLLSSIALIGFALMLLISRGEAIESLIWNGETHAIFPDFFQTVHEGSTKHPYDLKSVYPPLVYAICYVISLFIPGMQGNEIISWLKIDWGEPTISGIRIAFIILFALSIVSVSLMVRKYCTFDKKFKFLLLLLILFSAPMIFMLDRGNMLLIPWFLCMFFVFNYDNPSSKRRIMAILCLSVAMNFKPYLVVFSLLMLFDRRYRDFILCLIFSLVLFILPMLFMGGLSEIPVFIHNMLNLEDVNSRNLFGYGYKIGFANTVSFISSYLSTNFGIFVAESTINMIINASKILLGIGYLYVMAVSKTYWERVLVAFLFYIMVANTTWTYMGIYLTIPLMLILNQKKESRTTVLFTVLILLCLVPLPYGFAIDGLPGWNQIGWSTLASSFSLIAMSVSLIALNVRRRLNGHRSAETRIETETV